MSGFIRRNAIFISTICDIVGDVGYLAYAFHTGHGVSLPQAVGAIAANTGQVVLLAHGDEKLDRNSGGKASAAIRAIRQAAEKLTSRMPVIRFSQHQNMWGFGLLMLNGGGLLSEAAVRLAHNPTDFAMITQAVSGTTIMAGLGGFTLASSPLVETQETAERLFKTGAVFLNIASLSNIMLAATTRNPVVITLTTAFVISGLVKFLAKPRGKAAPAPAEPAKSLPKPAAAPGLHKS